MEKKVTYFEEYFQTWVQSTGLYSWVLHCKALT